MKEALTGLMTEPMATSDPDVEPDDSVANSMVSAARQVNEVVVIELATQVD